MGYILLWLLGIPIPILFRIFLLPRLPVILADLPPVTQLNWFVLVLGSLATFRVSHLMAKERGPLAVFERIRNAMPGGRGSVKNG